MSSVSNHSEPNDFLTKMINLSEEDQKKYINNDASTNEIVELFKMTFKNKSESENRKLDNIKYLTYVKVQEFYKDADKLNEKQINDILKICNKALPQVNHEEEVNFETRLSDLFSSSVEINQTNLGEMIGYALKLKSKPILDKCFEFIDFETNFMVRCEDFDQISFTVNFIGTVSNSDINLAKLNTCLMGLKKILEPNQIRVVVDRNEGLNLDRLLSFTNEHKDLIRGLALRGNDLTDSQLEGLLKNCPNVQVLKLNNGDALDGTGLREIGLLKDLEDFLISGCNNLVYTPDLKSNYKLETLNINNCSKISDPPLVTGLSQLVKITLKNCPSMNTIPELATLPKLNSLSLSSSKNIDQKARIKEFTTLLVVDPQRALNLFSSFEIKDTRDLEPKIKAVDFAFYFQNLHQLTPPNIPFRETVYNEIIENDPHLAINETVHFSHHGVLPIHDKNKQAFSIAVENDLLPEQSNRALFLAIYINDTALAKKAIDAGANINARYASHHPPLLRACKHGNAEMVNLLLEHHADAKYLGGTHEHETPLSEARLRGAVMADCLPLLTEKDAGFTDEVIGLKLLLHKFSSTLTLKVDGREFSAEGFRPRYIVDDFLKKNRYFYYELQREIVDGGGRIFDSFSDKTKSQLLPLLQDESNREKLLNAIKETFSAIEHALDHEAVDIQADEGKLKNEFLKDLGEGKPIVCYSVTNTATKWKNTEPGLHAWGLVVMKDPDSEQYLIHRCNRGYGNDDKSGVLIGKFDKEEMLEIVEKYQNMSNWKIASPDDADNFFKELTNKFPQESKLIFQKKQEAGNCCYYSLQAIELALLKSLLHPILGDKAAIECAREIKRIRTSQLRLKDLENYLDTHFPGKGQYAVDWSVLTSIYEKARAKPKLYRYNALIQDFTMRVMNTENRDMAGVIPQILVDAVNRYPANDVREYLKIRSLASAEERLPVIAEMIKQNLDMILKLRSNIRLKNNELAELILINAPEKIFDSLEALDFSIDEAMSFCMEHQIENIDLNAYISNITNDVALTLFKKYPNLDQFRVRFGTKSDILAQHDERGIVLNPIQALGAGASNVSGLKLSLCKSADASTFQALHSHFPNLTRLILYDCKNIDSAAIESLAIAFPNLNEFDMSWCDKFDSTTTQLLATSFPNLVSLRLQNYVDSAAIQSIAANCPKLAELQLLDSPDVNVMTIRALAMGCPNLERLNIAGCKNIDAATIQVIKEEFPKLSWINIRDCNVNSETIENLIASRPNLTIQS